MGWLTGVFERFFRTRHVAASNSAAEPSGIEWLDKLQEPFFRSRGDAEAYVHRAIAAAIPQGWGVRQFSGEHLRWSIEKQELEPSEWPDQDYGLWISSGLDVVILTHGNNDVGIFGLHHALQHAVVIDSCMLRKFTLEECLTHLFAHCTPNQRSAT